MKKKIEPLQGLPLVDLKAAKPPLLSRRRHETGRLQDVSYVLFE